ncbi:MAG: hypothetical protein ACI959_001672, partial [Limisphaerales bacterium]
MEVFKYIQLLILGFLSLGTTVFAQEAAQILWASELIDFSSQYGENGFSASQALGLPDTSPKGNSRSAVAWSPELENGGEEFIALRFPKA